MVRLFDANFARLFARLDIVFQEKCEIYKSRQAIEDKGVEMKNWRIALVAIVGGFLSITSTVARAEGGAGPEAMSMGNMCMVMFGYDMIHITAYQPGKSRSEYCEEIPSAGLTTFSYDIENPAFRDFPIDVRIIRDPLTPVSITTDVEALTEKHLPFKKYSKGTFSFDHEFKNTGHYIGMVTLERPDGTRELSMYKFSVGETLWAWVPQIAGTILIGGMLFVYWKHTRPSGSGSKKAAAETPKA